MSGQTPGSGFRLITDTSGVRHMVDADGVRQLTEEQPGIWDLAIAASNWHGIVQFAKGVLGAPEPECGETRTCYCGTTATVAPGVFPHPDCDGSVRLEPQSAPELAAAMAETREPRDLLAEILRTFGDWSGDGWRSRVGQVKYHQWRERAGLPK